MLDDFRSQEILWDKAENRIKGRYGASSGDTNGRTLKVKISNDKTEADTTGAVLSLAWHGNGHQGLDAFTSIDETIGEYLIYFTTGMLTNIGTLQASLVLVDSTGRIESQPFDIVVRRGIVDDEAVQSENSFTALTEALVKVSQMQEDFDGLYSEKEKMMDDLAADKGKAMDDLHDEKETKLDKLHTDEKEELDALEADYSERAENLEETYAPRLTDLERKTATLNVDAEGFLTTNGFPIVFFSDVSDE